MVQGIQMKGKVYPTLTGSAFLVSLFFLSLIWSDTAHAEANHENTMKPQRMRAWTDDLGRTREVPWPPQKIVVIGGARSPLEIICALGKAELIKARAEWNVWPPVLGKVPSIGRKPQINMELLMRCKPDFVISNNLFQQHIAHIEALGIPVLVFEPMDVDDTPNLIQNMGRLLDCPDKARELAAYVNRYLNLLQTRLRDLEPDKRPKVFMGRGRLVYYPAFSKGHRNVVEYAGGRNIANIMNSQAQQVTSEWMVEQNPDYLVIVPSLRAWGFQVPNQEIMQSFWDDVFNRPGVSILPLSKNNRLLLIDTRLGWGLRSFIGALYLSKKLHPHLFNDIDPTEVHRDFLKRFFNLELQGIYVYP